jgi:predicted ATPase
VLAEELGHPFSAAVGKWGATLITLFRGEDQVALERANEYVAFSKRHGFSDFARVAVMFQGIALAQTGAGSDRLAHMREVYELALTTRSLILWPWVLSQFLKSCLSLGALNEGHQAVDRELAVHAITGQRLFESEVRRGYGELLLAEDENRILEAEVQFQLALDIARRQSARSLELRAVMNLARLWKKQGKRQEARQQLATSYEWFTEGFDTADLIAAKNLLNELE